MALLRWWNNWHRLTFDQRWNRQQGPPLDGTNNVAAPKGPPAIGSWIKERYRTMGTYKHPASIRNLCRLIPFLAANPDHSVLTQLLGV
jgi:hypothetical protein